jgi:hypothetical protein
MDWHTVARHLDYGYGRCGSALGPPCSVYRYTAASNGDFIQTSNLVQNNVRCFRRINNTKTDQESPTHSFGTLFYQMDVDATFWEVGDVFVENDIFYGQGGTEVDFSTDQFEAYCLAFHGPVKKIIGARVDRTAYIYRPLSGPDSSGFFGPTIGDNVAPLVCTAGVWAIGTTGSTASKVPVGIMAMPRDRDAAYPPKVPGDTGQTMYFVYVPPLNGFNPREGDRIITDGTAATGVRYVVKHPYQQQAGASGSQLMCSRTIGQD